MKQYHKLLLLWYLAIAVYMKHLINQARIGLNEFYPAKE